VNEFATQAVERLRAAFESERDAVAAEAMSAYMRHMFPFMGISSSRRRSLEREALAGLGEPSEDDLRELALTLWALPEREYQYAATDTLARHVPVCGEGFLATLRELVTTRSWWDTVDALASHVAGPLTAAHPTLAAEIDGWAQDKNLWVARTAILHQLRFKNRTDTVRLFGYCLARAGEREFFIRKAIGWALREYSKTDADAVRTFVAAHRDELSPLSQREALLWLNGGRTARSAQAS
jgi:3-methyladenine DNA glycosylase AlkD